MTTPDVARKELIEFLEESGVTARFLTKKLDWDYTNFIKFKSGTVNISVNRATKLHQFLTDYKQMISQL